MNDFNINKIDFFNFDLDKYLDWLKREYSKLEIVNQLPLFDKLEIDYRVRKFNAISHYIRTRGEKLPFKIENLYNESIEHFKHLSTELKEALHYIIYFESCKDIISNPNKENTYIFYTKEQIKGFDFSLQHFNFWHKHLESWQNDFIIEFNEDLKKLPITEKKAIKKKLKELKSNKFEFIESICNGGFVANLDTFSDCFNFFNEVGEINKIIYLEIRLKGENPKLNIIKPIDWNGKLNALATLFNELNENSIINTSTENLKRLIVNNFTFKNKEISKHSLNGIFNKSKGKFSSKTIEKLKPLLQYLTENRP